MMQKFTSLITVLFVLVLAGCGSPYVPPRANPFDAPERPEVVIETSMGNIYLELYDEQAPKSVENFLRYVDEGFYNGLIFHRVVDDHLIQGGGFDEDLQRKETYDPIVNEASEKISNIRGSIAMARTEEPDSATSQFFINVGNNFGFDYRSKSSPGYAVFGRVIRGIDVCDQISDSRTTSRNGYDEVPVTPVYIIRAYRKN